jgi:hypothetical protein
MNDMTISLHGKVALVTGAARGIGSACVRVIWTFAGTDNLTHEDEENPISRITLPPYFTLKTLLPRDSDSGQRIPGASQD